jgi:hypothetical protein
MMSTELLVPARGRDHTSIWPQEEGQRIMSDDRSIITLPPQATTAIVDAVERATIDKGASKATRKAAFFALMALADAGLIKGSTSANSSAR